jgi:hypothetical protein
MSKMEKKVRLIRDKLTRIGIGEKMLTDETILASYTINTYGELSAVPRQGSFEPEEKMINEL